MGEENPIPTFSYLVGEYKKKFPNLAYIHVVSPGGPGNEGPKDGGVSAQSAAVSTALGLMNVR